MVNFFDIKNNYSRQTLHVCCTQARAVETEQQVLVLQMSFLHRRKW